MNRQTTPVALAKAATATPVDDFRIMQIVDLTGRTVGIVTQPDIHSALGTARARVTPYDADIYIPRRRQ